MTRGDRLLSIARRTLEASFGGPPVPVPEGEAWLLEKRAVFVTLKKHGALRGCIGQLSARLSLFDAVRDAAKAAAFHDPRFPRLDAEELPEVQLEVSVLSPLEKLEVHSEAEALAQIRPGIDGIVLTQGHRSGVFIPKVWEELAETKDFLQHLKKKAGLPLDEWLPGTQVERFTAELWEEP